MGMSWTGLGRGIERGIRLGMAMDQHEMNKSRAEEDAHARQQQRILTDMQIEKLKDANEREQTLRATNQTLYHLGSLKSDPQGYAAQLQENPDLNESVSDSINRVGQMVVDARGIDDGMQREFVGFTPTDDGRLMVNLRVTKPDGTVYEPPLTARGSTDPDDPVMAFTLDDLGGLTAAIDSEIKGLESQKVGLGDMSPMAARKAEIGRKQGIADEKDMLKFEYGLKGGLAKAKAISKAESKGGVSGWKQPEAEKHIKSLVATGLGLNRDSIDSWSDDQQKKFADTVDAVYQEWRANPDLGISGAYRNVISGHTKTETAAATITLEDKLSARSAKNDPASYEAFVRNHPKNKNFTEEQIQAVIRQRFSGERQPQSGAESAQGISKSKPTNTKEQASTLIDEVEKITAGNLTKSLARAQLNRLSSIGDAGYDNYRLMKLRQKLEDAAFSGIGRERMIAGE